MITIQILHYTRSVQDPSELEALETRKADVNVFHKHHITCVLNLYSENLVTYSHITGMSRGLSQKLAKE